MFQPPFPVPSLSWLMPCRLSHQRGLRQCFHFRKAKSCKSIYTSRRCRVILLRSYICPYQNEDMFLPPFPAPSPSWLMPFRLFRQREACGSIFNQNTNILKKLSLCFFKNDIIQLGGKQAQYINHRPPLSCSFSSVSFVI